MKQRFFQLFVALVALGWSSLCATPAFSHQFELGYVERSMDVVIRDRSVQISYAIGLADITMLEWLVREQQLETQQEQRYRRLIEECEANQNEEDGGSQQTEDAQAVEAATESVEPAQFQKELADLFKEKLSEKIFGNLQLTYDDQALEFSQQELVDTARHHVVLEARFIAEIPQRETGVLRLVDQNFLEKVESETSNETGAGATNLAVRPRSDSVDREVTNSQKETELPPSEFRFDGKVRRACRVKGGVVLVNSNVAPVLARAKAADVAQMNREQRVLSATIEAKLAFADQEDR